MKDIKKRIKALLLPHRNLYSVCPHCGQKVTLKLSEGLFYTKWSFEIAAIPSNCVEVSK